MSSETITPHSELVENLGVYQGIEDFVDGSVERVKGHLIPYMTESQDNPQGKLAFANRQARLCNINDCEPYLFLHLGHLSQDITLKLPETETFKAIEADATGYGESAVHVARELMLWYFMQDGRGGVLVERQGTVADTKLEAQQKGERSYQVFYRASDIWNWEHFTTGPLKGKLSKLVLRAESVYEGNDKFFQFRVYKHDGTNVTWRLLKADASQGSLALDVSKEINCTQVDAGAIGIDEIPFVMFGDGPCDSFLRSVWELNKALLNRGSVKSNVNYNQGFQRSFAIGADPEEISKAGECLISLLKNEKASISTIAAGDPTALENEEALIRRRLDRIAKFEYNQLSDDTRQVQSAESKAKDLLARKGIYDNTIDRLEEALEKIYKLHAKFEGAADDIDVTIARDFGLDDEAAELAELGQVFSEARELGAVEVQKAILRTRVHRLKLLPEDGKTREDLFKQLEEDIAASGQEGSALSADNRPSFGQRFQ